MNKLKTAIQEQFWALHQFQENDKAYNIISAVRIDGKLNKEKLVATWEMVFSKISLFLDLRKEQRILNDFHCLNATEAENIILNLINKKFELKNKQSINASIISVSEELNYFVLIQHHIMTDLHSVNLISKMISDIYNTGDSDMVLNDYMYISNELLIEKQKKFWELKLNQSPEALMLPYGKMQRTDFNGDGYSSYKALTKKSAKNLKIVSEEKNIQPFLILLVSYAVLLGKLSGQKDFFIGIPFTNRREETRKQMYGPFINILPLRVTIEENDSFISLYTKIRKEMLLLHRNQELPFHELSRFYRGKRDLRIPYFLQTGFTREQAFSLNLENLDCSTVNARPDGSQMDLFFTYLYDKDSIQCRWEYNSHAFTEKQIESWQNSYDRIIECFLTDTNQKLCTVPFISINEEQSMFDNFRNRKRNYPLEKPLMSHLIESYDKYSDNIAIEDESGSLTFFQFSQYVKKYAHYLFDSIGSGNNISIILNRSIDRILIIHAVLCSGNSYLPIDPNWPKERIRYLIANADVKMTITCDDLSQRIPTDINYQTIEKLKLQKDYDNYPRINILPEDSIAVLYTSGSTGNPKGVRISGKGITNRLLWMQESYPICNGDTLIHKVPYTFDVSIWEIFWSFLTGARLFIPDPIRHIDDTYLAEILKHESITYVHFVPSLLRKFFQNTSEIDLPDLKGVICSGEALDVSLMAEFYQKLPNKNLYNLYGPTEASIDVTSWTCTPQDLNLKQIPIGYPIANTRIYILNDDRLLCPPNVIGEIAIAGVNLALGYINNEMETSDHFITGNWGWGEETIYLTGDLGSSDEDSYINYFGRKDFQIKIFGIRIELSEIERQLEKNRNIKSAIVLLNEKMPKENQLVAYIIQSETVDFKVLRQELITFLPGYMIPATYHILEEFPMLNNGKIDKKKLLMLEKEVQIANKPERLIDQTLEYEDLLIKIWQRILKIENIAIDSNFFDLGGHSLLLPLLKIEIEKAINIEIDIMDLFKFPTINTQINLLNSNEVLPESLSTGINQRDKMKKMAMRNRNSRRK